MIELFLNRCEVSQSTEMRSLLYYLSDHLVFKHSIYYLTPTHEVGLLTQAQWNVTPQTLGSYETRVGWPRSIYAEYVECAEAFKVKATVSP